MTETLSSLKRFLRSKEWKPVHEFESFVIWASPMNDDLGKPVRVTVPVSSEFEDTDALIDKAYRLLSVVYSEPMVQLKHTIASIGYDSFRQRINLESGDNSISLEVASTLLKNLEKLIGSAACLEDDNQPFFSRGKKIAKETVKKCQFAHTFPGSFGVELQMPIPPSANASSANKAPFERRVMLRLGNGFRYINQAIRDADVSILLDNYDTGFNANIFEAIQELMQLSPNGRAEFTFTWSNEYQVPQDLYRISPIRLLADDAIPLLETASKELRKCSESEDTTVTGQIIQLHFHGGLLDNDDDLEMDDQEARRLMVLSWEAEPGRRTNLRVALSEKDHQQACNAYKDNLIISVKGRPEKRGRYVYLTAPREFAVLPPKDRFGSS